MVVDRRTVDSQLADIERSVRLLREEAKRPLPELVADPVRAFGVQHLLQISIEALSNISNHLASELGWEMPRSYVQSFENLMSEGVIQDLELAEHLIAMARFRNLVVHRYWKVEMDEVYRILQNHLDDLSHAAEALARYIANLPDSE